ASQGQGAGWFEYAAGVLEDILDAGANGVGVDGDEVVDVLFGQPEGFGADQFDGRAVREQADVAQFDAPAGRVAAYHGVGVGGLDSDDLDFGSQLLDVSGYACDQAAAA